MLHINYFKCADPARQKEYDFCFNRNKKSGFFKQIINYSGRMTYEDFFRQTRHYPDAVHILANLDIYFNKTILQAKEIKETEAYALTRWEEYEGKIVRFKERHEYNNYAKEAWSQDVWIIRGASKNVYGGFTLGTRGCDNRIAYELSRHYTVTNPCDKIQCIHKHANEERNYTITTPIPKPYRFISPNDELSYGRRRSI